MQSATRSFTGLLIAATLLSTGCSATLHHGALEGGATGKGSMAVASRANDLPHPLGWGTFTLFAIPVAPLAIRNGEGERELMLQVKDAVEKSGYQTKLVETPADAGDLPFLSCSVKEFRFRNYTWLFPFVPTWGRIALDFAVKQPDGQTVWTKSYTATGGMGWFSFSTPVNRALTRILNEFIRDFSAAQFGAPQETPAETTGQ